MHARWLLLPLLFLIALGVFVLLRRGGPEPLAVEPPARASAPNAAPEHGTAQLDPSGSTGSERAVPESGSEVDPLNAGASTIVSEVDLESAPVTLHGTLTDENTHQPLPEFRLEFEVVGDAQGADRRTSAVTDAQGKFRCEGALLVARSVVRFVDRTGHKRNPPPWTLEIDAVRKAELDLSVPWGPTYYLAFAPAERIQPAGVEVRLRGASSKTKDNFQSEWEPVHAGEKPWVRFPPVRTSIDLAQRLEARTRDGLWTGGAEARVLSGIAPGVTLLDFEPRAVLEGSVVDGAKNRIADADVTLDAHDATGNAIQRSSRTAADGRFRFDYLPPCTGNVRASSLRHAPLQQALTLLAEKKQELELVLTPLAVAGAIRVAVESESGRYAPNFSLRLTLAVDPTAAPGEQRFERHVKGEWKREGERLVARFEFPDLPEQEYRLLVEKDDYFAWDPLRFSLRPPADDVRIRILDGIPNAGLVFRIRDAQTGETLPDFALALEVPGAGNAARRLNGQYDRVFLEHLPLEKGMLWRLDAPGHAPAVGDLSAFQISERREANDVRVCELFLEPGWGEYYLFHDARSRVPLADVHVLLDGVEVAVTRADGRALVHARDKPARLEYTYAPYKYDAPKGFGAGKRSMRTLDIPVPPPAPPPRKKKPGG